MIERPFAKGGPITKFAGDVCYITSITKQNMGYFEKELERSGEGQNEDVSVLNRWSTQM